MTVSGSLGSVLGGVTPAFPASTSPLQLVQWFTRMCSALAQRILREEDGVTLCSPGSLFVCRFPLADASVLLSLWDGDQDSMPMSVASSFHPTHRSLAAPQASSGGTRGHGGDRQGREQTFLLMPCRLSGLPVPLANEHLGFNSPLHKAPLWQCKGL